MAIISRFVAFVAGSFAAVLILASVIDPDMFLHFEITPQRTTIFYIGLFGSILTISRNMIPSEYNVNDPSEIIRKVCWYTHYMPSQWIGNLHSKSVHKEFSEMFQLKIYIFFYEVLSVIFTPIILYYSLPKSSSSIIDFISQSTVHDPHLGYVCSFAHFDFKRHGNVKYGAPIDANNIRLMSDQGKLEKSVINFKANNPTWMGDDQNQTSVFVNKLSESMALNKRHHGLKHPEFGLGELYEDEREGGDVIGDVSSDSNNNNNNNGKDGMLRMLQQFSFKRTPTQTLLQPF